MCWHQLWTWWCCVIHSIWSHIDRWLCTSTRQTSRDQHYSEFTDDNQTTHPVEMRGKRGRTDRQRSVPFWILWWQSDHLQATNERSTRWNGQVEISTIVNSLMTIRPLTHYEWEGKRVEQTDRAQHHSEFHNDNQTTYRLWIREKQDGTDRQSSVPFNSPIAVIHIWTLSGD